MNPTASVPGEIEQNGTVSPVLEKWHQLQNEAIAKDPKNLGYPLYLSASRRADLLADAISLTSESTSSARKVPDSPLELWAMSRKTDDVPKRRQMLVDAMRDSETKADATFKDSPEVISVGRLGMFLDFEQVDPKTAASGSIEFLTSTAERLQDVDLYLRLFRDLSIANKPIPALAALEDAITVEMRQSTNRHFGEFQSELARAKASGKYSQAQIDSIQALLDRFPGALE